MKRFTMILPMLTFLVGGMSVALGQQDPDGRRETPSVAGRTFVLTVDGAGGYSTLANNLRKVYLEMQYPGFRAPILRPISWSTGNIVEDYQSRRLHLAGATAMLREIQQIRQTSPASRIVLIGYSAGASVVLAATEQLPPSTVDRVILLGPTVASYYDLRPTLRASKMGVDVFFIPDDQFLETLQDVLGAPYDDPGTTVAGTTGFRFPNSRQAGVDPVFGKLRQYPMPNLPWEHFGTARPDFLRTYVVPMIP